MARALHTKSWGRISQPKAQVLPFPSKLMPVKGQKSDDFTVLVVEDDPDIRELLKITLEVAGYRVIEAENGFDGIEAARQHEPDAILMDMSMPLMDGCQCT